MRLLLTLLAAVLLGAPTLAQEILPFPVTVGGQTAVKVDGDGNWAHVEQPVAAGAAMAVKDVSGQVIVNIYPCDDKGTIAQGAECHVLLFDAKESKSIDANVMSKKLPAGWYAANVVAGANTSRVLFQVK